LIFACVAKLENAWLVTLDQHFAAVRNEITVIDLNDSREGARYRSLFL
jgi:hypothetical protein